MISNFLAPLVVACNAALTALFAPPHPQAGRYEVCTTARPANDSIPEHFQAAPAERLEALDAFGPAGTYDRAKLAQLFGGQRITVIRAWRQTGEAFESVTLLSPYPDADLRTIQPGTMMIRWILPAR